MKSKIFPNADGIYERYHALRNNDPYKNKRQKYLLNYDRKPWKRGGTGKERDHLDPNYGQFKSKIDAAIGTFTQVLSERAMTVRITPRYAPTLQVKPFSDKISASFHRLYIKPWEKRFIMEALAAFDMVMYAKAIEYWPNPYCIYSKSVPVERVFPDSNATHDPAEWNYCFIEVNYTMCELELMMERIKDNEKETEDDYKEGEVIFKKDFLAKIIENPEMYGRQSTEKREDKRNRGEITEGTRDYDIPIVFAYVKDRLDKEKKVSLYCFPAEVADKKSEEHKEKVDIKLLFEKQEYCECISQAIANRCYQITRNWWSTASFAEQIFLATALYDKAMSLVVRAAKRNSVMFVQSDSPNAVAKILRMTDDEVQHMPADAKYVAAGQNNNIREVMETVRQIMIDTENGQNLAQAPGSQNVKGYAITAQEAQIRAQSRGESETLNIKMLMSIDVALWKEIYRRAMENEDPDFKKAHAAFVKEMKAFNIDPEHYDFENVYFSPSFLNGGSQGSRIQNAMGVAQALAVDPKNAGQEQAQRDMIAAHVGHDNVDNYMAQRMEPSPVIHKVGQENEDLDNPYANPMNIPVLPDDKHMEELPFHLMDYEMKLTMAEKIMQSADQNQNPIQKTLLLSAASDLIKAQDNKGAHINAHLQQVEGSELNKTALQEIIPRYKAAQQKQDQMAAGIDKVLKALAEGQADQSLNNEKLRHQQAMNQLTENHAKTMNEVGLEKSLQQRQSGLDKTADKRQADLEQKGTTLAFDEKKKELDLEKKQDELNFKKQELAAKAAQQQEKAGTTRES